MSQGPYRHVPSLAAQEDSLSDQSASSRIVAAQRSSAAAGPSSVAPPSTAFSLNRVVEELRQSRDARLGERGSRLLAAPLPSRAALESVTNGLKAALFPAHFGPPDITDESVDFFVGHTLADSLRELELQVLRELRLVGDDSNQVPSRARELVREFSSRIPQVHRLLETDVRAAYEGDPAARSLDEAIFCYPGITAMLHHRLAHELYQLGTPLLSRIISEIAHTATGIDIHPGAQIGPSFFVDHGTGVVIGETTIVGARVRIYQGVTLGAKTITVDEAGVAHKGHERHPIVEDDVVVYAGATILGRVRIGQGSVIGGNVWLTRSVPPGSRITQVQARTEAFQGGLGI